MDELGRHTWQRFVRVAKPYFCSEARGPAFRLLAALIALR
jgi:hypothetical protein